MSIPQAVEATEEAYGQSWLRNPTIIEDPAIAGCVLSGRIAMSGAKKPTPTVRDAARTGVGGYPMITS